MPNEHEDRIVTRHFCCHASHPPRRPITPPTAPKPTPPFGRPWAFGIRSGVYRPAPGRSIASCLDEVWKLVAGSIPYIPPPRHLFLVSAPPSALGEEMRTGRKKRISPLPPAQKCAIIPSSTFFMQRYRSGHNGADSKSVCGQPHVGSNPTRCAKKKHPHLLVGVFFYPGGIRTLRG